MKIPSELSEGTPRTLATAPRLHGTLEPFSRVRFNSIRYGWEELTSSGPFAEPFYRPAWFQAFANSFAREQRTMLLTVWRDSDLRGVLPLIRRSSFFGGIPARAYTSLSGIHSCRYDLIHDPVDGHHIVKLMWDTLKGDDSWDVIEVEDVPADGAFPQLLEEARGSGCLVGTWSTRTTPVLHLPEKGSNPLGNCPKNFKGIRSRLGGKLKRLREQGEVVFEVHSSGCEEPFKRFLMLESSGWKAGNKSAITCSPPTTRFYSSVVEAFTSQGLMRIYALRVGEQTIAMHLGLTMNGVYYTPKVAYDEAFARYSPGQLLNHHVIGDLCQQGFRTYDFLGPRAAWKAVWTSQTRQHNNYYIFRPSIRGRTLHALTMRGAAMLRRFRRKLYGDPQALAFEV